jgi:hypothetical protein
MIGFPVLVIAMSWMDLRAGAAKVFVGAASRGRTEEQHLCMAIVVQRRKRGS